jgi:anti-sigma factor RsiW
MACEDRRADLTAYVDRELAPEKAQEFVAHLRTCASCAADVVDRLEWKRATQAAGRRHLPSAEFRERIERQVTAKERNGWFAAWAPAVAAVAATALFVLAATGWWHITEQRQVLRELADLHVTTLAGANPVDVVSSDRHTVKPWFAGRIPFTFDLPELAGSPFTLLGGRVVYASGEPAAQLLYQVRQHKLSVFIFQDRAGPLARLLPEGAVSKEATFTAAAWSRSGLRYIILSDVATEDVQRLRELFRSASRAH